MGDAKTRERGLEGWSIPTHPEPATRGVMANWIYEGVFAQPTYYLNQPGNYVLVTLLTGALGVNAAAYGGLLAVPFWCNVLQLAIAPPLLRRWSAKRVFLTAIAITIVVWLAAGWLLIQAGDGPSNVLVRFSALYFVSSLCTSVGAIAWTNWIHRGLPSEVRAHYFGRRNRLLQFALLGYILGTMSLFRVLGHDLKVYAGLFVFAAATRAISLGFAVRNPAPEKDAEETLSLRRQVSMLRSAQSFLLYAFCGACWGATANLAAPFIPVFLLRECSWNSGQIGGYFVASLLAGALAFPVWGRLINLHGARAAMLMALVAWALLNAGWFLLSVSVSWIAYPLGALIGATNAGMVLGSFHLVLSLVPPRARSLAIGLNTALTSCATAMAPVASGITLVWLDHHAWTATSAYRLLFTAQLVACGITVVLLRRLREPAGARVREVLGAMANLRTLGAVLGLGFLFEYVFTARSSASHGAVSSSSSRRTGQSGDPPHFN